MISQAAFQLQVNRHMTATEWLVNSSYAYWQNNADSYADFFAAFGSTLICDAVAATQALTQFALVLYSAFTVAVAQANATVESFVDERTDEVRNSPEVSWADALTSILRQDFIAPIVSLWAVLNIWESSLRLRSGLTLNRHIQ